MSDTLPDLYALLHVDPGAPQEIIRASYRTLMQRLRAHPDLGGDHAAAAALNAAWATLRDPVRRAAYDAQRRAEAQMRGESSANRAQTRTSADDGKGDAAAAAADYDPADSSQAKGAESRAMTDRGPAHRASASHRYGATAGTARLRPAIAERCPFCRTAANDRAWHAGTSETCARCSAPLTLVQRVSPEAAASQRTEYRISRAESLRIHVDCDDRVGVAALVHDISVTGMRFSCARALSPGEIIRAECAICAAVARIAHAAADTRGMWQYGAEFITVRFRQQRGSLLSVPV